MIRAFLRSLMRLLFRLLTHLEVDGIENLPQEGGCIVTPNHLSALDPVLIFALIGREDITGLVAKKHHKNLFYRLVVNIVHGIWLNREEADTHALRAASDHLQKGGMLGISPEGTRSKTGALIPAKTGVAYLADKAGVPILPVAIIGTETGVKQLLRFHRPHLIVRFGQLFKLDPIDRTDRNGSLKRNTDEIMCHIAALLPPQYRGVYSEHPRLKELLEPINTSVGLQA